MVDPLAVSLLVVVALVVRTALGFGFSLVFVPFGSLLLGFSEAFLAAILLELLVSTLMAVQFRGRLQLLNAVALKAWGLLGILIGLLLKTLVDEALVVTLSMVAVVAACLALLAAEDFEVRPTRAKLGAAGASSGFLNSWTSLSGPPVVFYYLLTESDDQNLRGALTGYFWILYSLTFVLLLIEGEYAGFDDWSVLVGPLLTILVAFPLLQRSRGLREIEIRRPALLLLAVAALAVAVGQIA